MPYRVFETDQKGADLLTKDELVNRQTIVIKDGQQWGVQGKVVLIDGTENALDTAEKLVKSAGGRVSTKGDKIKHDIDAEEDNAAGGVGFIFG
jgi:hypothetical protein